jgi:hypothetical protein
VSNDPNSNRDAHTWWVGVNDSTEKSNIHTRLISTTDSVCFAGGVDMQSRYMICINRNLVVSQFGCCIKLIFCKDSLYCTETVEDFR